jgi:hypothetical protein
MACTVCGNDGHKKRTCKLKLRELEENLLEGFNEVSDGEAVVESALALVCVNSRAEDNVVREDFLGGWNLSNLFVCVLIHREKSSGMIGAWI